MSDPPFVQLQVYLTPLKVRLTTIKMVSKPKPSATSNLFKYPRGSSLGNFSA